MESGLKRRIEFGIHLLFYIEYFEKAEPAEVHIAGWMVSVSINENYADPYLRIPLSENEAKIVMILY